MVMNKLQWISIILSFIALILYFSMGFNIVIFLIVAIDIVIIFYLALRQRYCSKCETKLPKFRKPKNQNQALFGGWTCPKCHTELDSSGNVVKVSK